MKNETLVRIYVKPLFELSVEGNRLEAIAAEVKTLGELFRQVPLLTEYLDSPNVSRRGKLDLLGKAYGAPWSKHFGNFLDLALRKGRQEILPFAWETFEHLWDEYNAKLEVVVTSATELTEAQKQALQAKLARRTGKKIMLKSKLDPSVLGGLRVQIGHQLVDATVAGKLAALKESLLKSA